MPKQFFKPKYWPVWLVILLFKCLCLLPYRVIMGLATVIGHINFHCLTRRRNIAEINIALCFPELSAEQQQQLVKNTMINMAKAFFEMALCWWASDKRLATLTQLEGLELLTQYQSQGRGVILLGMHYTTIEMAAATMGLRNKVDITYKAQRGSLIQWLMQHYRQRHFAALIEKNAMRQMVRNLRNGHVIWYAPDQDFGREGAVFAPFFNRPAATLTTLTKLQRLTGAKVLVFSHFRYADGPHRYIGKVIDPFETELGDDEYADACAMNQAFENLIRDFPDQYNWMHERFRTRQDPEQARVYPKKIKKKKKSKG